MSLSTGVSGMRVHQQMMEVVGNNLANQNTTAYKTQRTSFADLVYDTIAAASSSSGGVGGTNPQQVGFGAQMHTIDTSWLQGRMEDDGNPLHLGIQGNGFFVVDNGVQSVYSRDGAFAIDVNNYLIDPGTGYRVQRFGTVGEGGTGTTPVFQTSGDNDILIPIGTGIPAQQTTTATLQGNLSAQATGPRNDTLTSSAAYTTPPGATPATAATLLNALNQNTVDYIVGDTITITGVDVNGAAVNVPFAYFAGATLGDLAAAISAAYPLATASINATGNVVLTADATGPGTLSMTLSDAVGNTGATTFATNPKTTVGKNGDTVSSIIQIFDIQGTAHNLSLTFTKQGTNVWDLAATIPAADGTMLDGSVTGITFNDNGSLAGITGTGVGDPDIQFQITGLANPQTINFDFGTLNAFDGLTGFGGSSTAAATDQDGYAAGTLAEVTVDADGVINGIYTNGETFDIAQIAVATFVNPSGLNREGTNYFGATTQSGVALIGAGGSGGRGQVRSGVLESSNVDVAEELTRLVIAQRGFQVNARSIRVANEVLDEVANIIR